jgi:cbb3-type cytochrome oxidase subunit 3
MPNASLTADCARCAALCCVAYAFDRSSQFAFDKAANRPCPNLTLANSCGIHAQLAESGFGGCASYDCHGAGQAVTQEIFGGRSWRDDPHLLKPMAAAFRVVREAHELAIMLEAAASLPLPEDDDARRKTWLRALMPDGTWTAARVALISRSGAIDRVRLWFRDLGARLRDPRFEVGRDANRFVQPGRRRRL